MSIELYAFLTKNNVPSQIEWQKSIDKFGFDFKIDPELKPFVDSGFSPCKLSGEVSGFEIYYETSKSITNDYPEILEMLDERDCCISFRFGGDVKELISSLIASASLIKSFDALVYDPSENVFYQADDIIEEVHQLLGNI
jgi:hypothetical protein